MEARDLVVEAMESSNRVFSSIFTICDLLERRATRHDDELSELRDAILTLSNRIEAVTRTAAEQSELRTIP